MFQITVVYKFVLPKYNCHQLIHRFRMTSGIGDDAILTKFCNVKKTFVHSMMNSMSHCSFFISMNTITSERWWSFFTTASSSLQHLINFFLVMFCKYSSTIHLPKLDGMLYFVFLCSPCFLFILCPYHSGNSLSSLCALQITTISSWY